MTARYVVGIDLGTTNSALAHVDPRAAARASSVDEIAQLVGAGRGRAARRRCRRSSTSPASTSCRRRRCALPWDADDARSRRRRARARAGRAACRGGWSRRRSPGSATRASIALAPILPWGESDGERAAHLAGRGVGARTSRTWPASGSTRTGRALADEDVVLSVPASFDEVARELTRARPRRGRARAGHAARGAAGRVLRLARRSRAPTGASSSRAGDAVLVFDVGGGTTDFTLIAVAARRRTASSAPRSAITCCSAATTWISRSRAASRARLARGGTARRARSCQQLVQACRVAKERLLGDERAPSRGPITVAGRGAQADRRRAARRAHARRGRGAGARRLLPARRRATRRPSARRAGLQEFGLPYAADPAITRHLAAFLRAHGARPTAVLFNGGVLKSAAIRARVLEVLDGWLRRRAARARERRARAGGRARRRLLRPGAPRPRRCASAAARRAPTTSASTPRRSRPGRSTVLCADAARPRGGRRGRR